MHRSSRPSTALSWVALASALLIYSSSAPAMTVTEVIDHGDLGHVDDPWGIVADADGTVYVAGFQSNNVIARAPDGTLDVILDSSGGGTGHHLEFPEELAIAPDGTLYVAAIASVNVFKRPPGGSWSQILDASGDGAGHPLQYPRGLTVDAAGNAFVADPLTDTVFRIDAAGAVTVVIDGSGDGTGNTLDQPEALATDAAGNLYVAGATSDNVFLVTPAGTVSLFFANAPGHPVDYPAALAVDATGNVYVGAAGNSLVWRVAPGGSATVVAYSIDAVALAARSDGMLFVAGSNKRSIIGIRPGGPNCTVIDAAGDGTTPFGFATRFALTASGDVFASNVSYDDVFRIDDACTGPSVDFTGRWYLTMTRGDGSTFSLVQDWVQSGFAVTVTDATTGDPTFTGTVDDRDHIVLRSTASICAGMLCCEAQTLTGDPSTDGFGWTGSLSDNAFFTVAHCGPYETYSVVANHCGNGVVDPGEGCEDGNAIAGDGCDPTCHTEPCYACSGDPSLCLPAPRSCAGSTKAGGVSLKISPAANGHTGSLKWQLAHGVASEVAALGDPRTHTAYDVCVFDRSQATPQLLFHAGAPIGSAWKPVASRGFSYRTNTDGYPDGISKLVVQTSSKTKISLIGSGGALQLPPLPFPLPLTVQLQTSDGGCFEASYSSTGVVRNDASGARLKADP